MRIIDWSSDVCSSELPGAVFHGAHKLASNRQDAGRYRTLQIFGCAHVNQTCGDGAGGQAMLHQGNQDRVDNAQVDRTRSAAHDLGEHDVSKSTFSDQIIDKVLVAIAHDGKAVRSEERRVGKGCVSKCRTGGWRD